MKIKTAKQHIVRKQFLFIFLMLAITVLVGILYNNAKGKTNKPNHSSTKTIISNPDLAFLLKESSFEEVLDYYKDKRIVLSVYDEASNKMTKSFRGKMKAIGGEKLSELSFQQSYVALIKEGRFVMEEANVSKLVQLDFEGYSVYSGGSVTGSQSYIQKEGKKHEINKRGLNVFVLGAGEQVFGQYSFDFYAQNEPYSTGKVLIPMFHFLDKIKIVVKEQNYLQLKHKRDESLKEKILFSKEEDLVSARIVFKEKQHKAKIRLKGDWTDHLEGEQWSFRVKLNAEESLMGMRKFSLHHPKIRNYAGEWLFHQLLADAEIINLQYHFVQVELTIVGEFGERTKQLGVYALEEFFDKNLIERNQRKESVILKIDEDPLWQERADFISRGLELKDLNYVQITKYKNLNILPFSEKKVRQDSILFKSFLAGKSLFQAYIDEGLKISDVFDVKKLARYNAICNIMGANHALLGHNYRVYYNPINGRLEPIGFDANAATKEWLFLVYEHGAHDLKYMETYAKALEEITSEDYYQKIIHYPGLTEKTAFLESAYPDYQWSDEIINHNRQLLKQALYPSDALNVFFIEIDGDYLRLDIENYGSFPVKIMGLENEKNRIFAQPMDADVVLPKKRLTVSFKLDKNYKRLFVNKKKHKIGFDLNSDINSLQLTYKTLGTSREMKVKILPWRENYTDIAEANLFKYRSNVKQFDFLSVDEKEKVVTCQPGLWRLEKELIIPEGYVFKVGPGCRIDLLTYLAKIVSYAPVEFIGRGDNPCEIFSSTGQGQGIIVLNTKDTSIISHCKFTNLSQPSTKAWGVSGAVSFYDAPVKIFNSSFSDNRCEDALNIVKTYFEMDNVVFRNTFSDAFDGDFVNGEIKNTLFGDLGNDAIDVSGSDITVDNTTILNAGDKGLSAGEGSHIVVSNIIIKNSEIAVAAKDKSTIELSVGLLKNNKLAFTAFQKKSAYGSASIHADRVDVEACEQSFLIEKGSSLSLNGKFVETVEKVKERMYGIEFGKKSQ